MKIANRPLRLFLSLYALFVRLFVCLFCLSYSHRYNKEPTAPPDSEDTPGEITPPKRSRLLTGAGTETDTDTDSLKPSQTDDKPRRSNRNKMRRSLSVGM